MAGNVRLTDSKRKKQRQALIYSKAGKEKERLKGKQEKTQRQAKND